jgi:hypothetical protein
MKAGFTLAAVSLSLGLAACGGGGDGNTEEGQAPSRYVVEYAVKTLWGSKVNITYTQGASTIQETVSTPWEKTLWLVAPGDPVYLSAQDATGDAWVQVIVKGTPIEGSHYGAEFDMGYVNTSVPYGVATFSTACC